MRINCLSCGHGVELGDAYDYYDGLIRCWVCGAALEIAVEDGRLRRMRLPATAPRSSAEGVSELAS